VSLAARQLEENGIATVVIGSAKDIVEYCGVPRFVFTDFPLGNPCGRPYDKSSQQAIMASALDLLTRASGPGTTVQTPFVWDESCDWKTHYMRVGADNIEALRAAGEARQVAQAKARTSAAAVTNP
jgi:hypothetical protein